VQRFRATGAIVPGTDHLDRLWYQLTATNNQGTWLFNEIGVLDDESLTLNSTCTATDT
jgi:hypothetical protein